MEEQTNTSDIIIEDDQIPHTNESEIKDKTAHQLGTEKFIQSIKNQIFKKNILDTDTIQAVSSIYLVKKTKLNYVRNYQIINNMNNSIAR